MANIPEVLISSHDCWHQHQAFLQVYIYNKGGVLKVWDSDIVLGHAKYLEKIVPHWATDYPVLDMASYQRRIC